MKEPKHLYATVTWNDAWHSLDDYEASRTYKPLRQIDQGWLGQHTDHGVTLASSFDCAGGGYRTLGFIPTDMIISIEVEDNE